ncbi:hypothetical protein L798_07818 [Zootermopsis nevadensis]|uniref:Uncharacterized protein n=1 Tax=Zootermopsis nevadensis TaxID=136037 RepID=A0A067R4C3_ZOONE|nr:hypothetical protein L798_07818 [Zootermopsis nevadensis]
MMKHTGRTALIPLHTLPTMRSPYAAEWIWTMQQIATFLPPAKNLALW